MSSVRAVRVVERRAIWAFNVDMCDCDWDAIADSEGCWGFERLVEALGEREGRVLLR